MFTPTLTPDLMSRAFCGSSRSCLKNFTFSRRLAWMICLPSSTANLASLAVTWVQQRYNARQGTTAALIHSTISPRVILNSTAFLDGFILTKQSSGFHLHLLGCACSKARATPIRYSAIVS